MKHFNPRRARGIAAVRANADGPAKVLAELSGEFGQFKSRYDDKLAAVEAGLDDLAGQVVAARIGGDAADTGAGARAMGAIGNVLREARSAGGPVDVTARLATAVQASGMSVGSNPDGGYSVLPVMDRRIREIERDQGAMRGLATVQQIGSDAFEFLLNNSVAEYGWVGETESRPDTEAPALRKITIPAHEIYAQPKATQKLLDDSAVDIAAWLAGQVGLTFGEQESAAFIAGDGMLKPRGLLTYPTAATADDTREWGTFEHLKTGASGDFGAAPAGADKLIETIFKLKVGYRRNAAWLMSSATASLVMKLKDSEGRFVFVTSMREGEPSRLVGYPVAIDENMPSPAANSLSIAFGDFSRAYTIVDRIGIRVLVDPFTEKPNVRFYTTKRVGGDVVDFNAMKFLKFAA